jgi:LDH2 family malate/lactate/ureidoglycolate dehydrogenase
MFRKLDEFKKEVETAIKELKTAPKMKGFEEIYFAGEQSAIKMEEALKNDVVEVSDTLYNAIREK